MLIAIGARRGSPRLTAIPWYASTGTMPRRTWRGFRPLLAKPTGCYRRPSANMSLALARRRRSGGDRRSRQRRQTTTARENPTLGVAQKVKGARQRSRSTASLPIPGVFTMCMGTSGNGERIVGQDFRWRQSPRRERRSQRRLHSPRPSRRFLVQRAGIPPFRRRPPPGYPRRARQQQRFPSCENALASLIFISLRLNTVIEARSVLKKECGHRFLCLAAKVTSVWPQPHPRHGSPRPRRASSDRLAQQIGAVWRAVDPGDVDRDPPSGCERRSAHSRVRRGGRRPTPVMGPQPACPSG